MSSAFCFSDDCTQPNPKRVDRMLVASALYTPGTSSLFVNSSSRMSGSFAATVARCDSDPGGGMVAKYWKDEEVTSVVKVEGMASVTHFCSALPSRGPVWGSRGGGGIQSHGYWRDDEVVTSMVKAEGMAIPMGSVNHFCGAAQWNDTLLTPCTSI